MNCRDFERIWNERLDAPDAALDGVVRSLDEHAASCPDCQAAGTRYQTLGQAILALTLTSTSPPSLSPGFVDRVLAEAARPEPQPILGRILPRFAKLAAAAAILAIVALSLSPKGPEPVANVRVIDSNDLTSALADAGSATLDFAREASAPAARVGRQVIGSAGLSEESPTLTLPEGMTRTSNVWQNVEDRVQAGVRPLEGTARHAFGFLIGLSPDDDRPPVRPARGA